MTRVKVFKTYTEQVELLRSRGMRIDDVERAEEKLARLNYYRLSGVLVSHASFFSGYR